LHFHSKSHQKRITQFIREILAIRKTILDVDADLVLSLPSNLNLLLKKYTMGRAPNVNLNDSQNSYISQQTTSPHLMPADDE
jgi:hypothetical protein